MVCNVTRPLYTDNMFFVVAILPDFIYFHDMLMKYDSNLNIHRRTKQLKTI